MRGNGLEAGSYVALADVDPRVADVLLDRFREAGVAAYVVPCEPAQGILLEVRLPDEPRERLHVDESALEKARELLRSQFSEEGGTADGETGDGETAAGGSEAGQEAPAGTGGAVVVESDDGGDPGPARDKKQAEDESEPESDEDRAFAEIVAGYESEPATPVAPWPTAEDADDNEDDGESDGDGERARDEAGGDRSGEPVAGTTTADDADRYVPPPPPPLPRLDPLAKAGWAALIGGPVMLLLATVVGAYVPDWFAPVGVAAFLAGFVVLVARMRGGPPDQSDDGAVV